GTRRPDAERRAGEPAGRAGAAARAAAPDDLAAQRERLGRGEHDHRGTHGPRSDSASEAGRRPRHRRVPVEQDRRVAPERPVTTPIAVIQSTETAAVAALLSPRRAGDTAADRAAVRIVEAVRKGGD